MRGSPCTTRDTHVNRALARRVSRCKLRLICKSLRYIFCCIYIYIYSLVHVVSSLIMVAPGADGKRAKGPLVVAAYLLHNAGEVLPGNERERKRLKEEKRRGKIRQRKEEKKSEAR